MSIPWQDIAYLARGNQRQRRAHRALERLQVLRVLRRYTPILVGTVPIAIDIHTSDLDVICEVYELDVFERLVVRAFGQQEDFRIKRKQINALPVIVANFEAEFPIEIFGQPRPVVEQNAYRHMDVQARLLTLGGDQARREISRLKRAGLKTEPAFARYFGIQGDPFEALLELSRLDEQELRGIIESNREREKDLL